MEDRAARTTTPIAVTRLFWVRAHTAQLVSPVESIRPNTDHGSVGPGPVSGLEPGPDSYGKPIPP